MPGTVTLSGMSAGEPAGERLFGPLTVVGKAIIGETLAVQLASGTNTYTVPSESVAVLIIMPINGETATKFKTSLNSGDAGLPMNPGPQPFFYVFPETPPTLITLTAATNSGVVTIIFI